MKIEEYLTLKYGSPTREALYKTSEGTVIKILKWDQDSTNEGVTMYVTVGASYILGNASESCEFFVGLTPEVDEVAEALAEVALTGNGSLSIPSSGDSLTLSFSLWKDTNINTFLFTNGDEIIEPYNSELKLIKFIQLVPIYPSELNYKIKFGEEEMWNRFEELQVPYWMSNRQEYQL